MGLCNNPTCRKCGTEEETSVHILGECEDLALLRHTYWPDHDQQHCYHHAPTVKPEAATAVVELLMMGVMMPETC